eukprot:636134-Lingulodinium_polyedra.AAC.1
MASTAAKKKLMGLAGRLARMRPGEFAVAAVRCRGLQWWRRRQAERRGPRERWQGPRPHSRRFRIC